MLKGSIILAIAILAVPIFGLAVSAGVGAKLAVTADNSQSVCEQFGDPKLCYQEQANAILWKSSAALLAVTIFVPGVYTAFAHLLGRRRELLARFFPWIVRPTMFGIAAVLVLHGLLVFYASYQLSIAVGYGGFVFWSAILGLAFCGAALIICLEAVRRWSPEPIPVIGVVLESQWLPELTERVARVADRVGVRPPARIIVGLEVSAFVTALPIALRGQGVLPPGETLYLPACALRLLDGPQLDSVIGHELAHFRGADLAFTERFLPSLFALHSAIENVTPEESQGIPEGSAWSRLAKIPAMLLMQWLAMTLMVAVNRIRRERELLADAVGAQIAGPASSAHALITFSLMMPLWKAFRAANRNYLESGRSRRNLSLDYLQLLAKALAVSDRNSVRLAVLSTRLTHPTDTHPSLADRLGTLGVDPEPLIQESIEKLQGVAQTGGELAVLEETITAVENDWVSLPGTRVVPDLDDRLPLELSLGI